MAHKWAGWTIPSVGKENAPNGSDAYCPGNEIRLSSFTLGRETWDEAGNYSQDAKGARQDLPHEFAFHKEADINTAFGRVDVVNPIPSGLEVPSPFTGDAGQPIDFGPVGDRAADEDHGADAPDGGADQGSSKAHWVGPRIHD